MKINSKWNKDLNIRLETITLLQENSRMKAHDIGFSKDFLNMTQKEQATKVKIGKSNYIKSPVHQRTQSTE